MKFDISTLAAFAEGHACMPQHTWACRHLEGMPKPQFETADSDLTVVTRQEFSNIIL